MWRGPPRLLRLNLIVNNFFILSLDFVSFMWYTISIESERFKMMKTENIFKVTIATCWETSKTTAEFIKARDEAHALRIANRLFGNDVISAEFACEDNLN